MQKIKIIFQTLTKSKKLKARNNTDFIVYFKVHNRLIHSLRTIIRNQFF